MVVKQHNECVSVNAGSSTPCWIPIALPISNRHFLNLQGNQTSHIPSSIVASWYGNDFRIAGPVWGKSTCHWWIPSQRAIGAKVDVFFIVSMNKLLQKGLNAGDFIRDAHCKSMERLHQLKRLTWNNVIFRISDLLMNPPKKYSKWYFN